MLKLAAAAIACCFILFSANASAGVIISAESASASSTFINVLFDFRIRNTRNQSGIDEADRYDDGVDDFDDYFATNPGHNPHYLNESGDHWSNVENNDPNPWVLYDLGDLYYINALAIWVGRNDGIGSAQIYGSEDGTNYTHLADFDPPVITNDGSDILADLIYFAPALVQYIRIDLDCTHDNRNMCNIGEVAFRVADDADFVSEVPIPAAFPLLLSGLAGLGFAARRRKASKQ